MSNGSGPMSTPRAIMFLVGTVGPIYAVIILLHLGGVL